MSPVGMAMQSGVNTTVEVLGSLDGIGADSPDRVWGGEVRTERAHDLVETQSIRPPPPAFSPSSKDGKKQNGGGRAVA